MLTVGLTSAGSGVGSALLRSLALSSLETRIVCLDSAPGATGLHRGHRGLLIPKVSDSGYAEAVLQACVQEGVQVLIPGLDSELEPLANLSGRLKENGCQLLCSAPGPIRLLRDKLLCSDYFRAAGLPFVHSLPLSRVEEMVALHGFPLLVKPLAGSASRGVQVLFNQAELDRVVEDLARHGGESHIVQNYLIPAAWGIRKEDLRYEHVYANHALVQKDEHMVQILLDPDGTPFGLMTSVNALKDGAISRMEPLEADATGATAAALRMAAHLAGQGLVGPCNFQSRVTEEGPFVYEINPRFSGGTGGRAALGFNEVEACLRRLVLGESREQVQACLKTRYGQVCAWHPMELVMEREDIEALGAGRMVRGPLVEVADEATA